jgi:hypothetical protein
MTTLRVAVLASIVGLAGLAAGFQIGKWVPSRLLAYGMATSAIANVAFDGMALERMHGGNPEEAKQILYTRLDGEILAIDAAVQEGFRLTPKNLEAIARIRMLRDMHVYRSANPEIRAMVDEALERLLPMPNKSLELSRER